MNTEYSYNIYFGNFLIEVESDMWWRFRDWALDNRIKFTETQSIKYNGENEEDETEGEDTPQKNDYNLWFTYELPRQFLKSITFFNWERK